MLFFRLIDFKLLLVVLLFACLTNTMANPVGSPWYQKTFVSKVWDNKSGLPQNTVFDLQKDHQGFLWVATEEGMARFDGNTFEVYNDFNIAALASSSFYAISPSRKGGIWAAIDNAIVRFHQNKFLVVDLKKHVKNSRISCITEDAQGRLWVGTQSGELFYLLNNSVFLVKAWAFSGKKSIQALVTSPNGLYIGTDGGLYQLDKELKKVTQVPGYETKYIRTLAVAQDHSLWIGTKEHGVFHHTQGQDVNYTVKDGLAENFITALSIAPDGTLWAGTLTSGLHKLEKSRFSPVQLKGVPEDGVRAILFSSPNIMWLGTAASGLVQLKPAEVQMLSPTFKESNKVILPIYQHPNGDVWMGTNGTGVTRISKGKSFSYSKLQGLATDLALSIAGTKGAVFIGTPSGLNRFNLNTGKIDRTYTQQDGLRSDIIQAIYADSKEKLWIATRSGGIHLLLPTGEIQKAQLPKAFANIDFVSIFEDRQQNMWFGSRGAGMVRISAQGELTNFTITQGLPAGIIDCFYQDPEGDLWLGTDKGLVCFTGNRFILFNKTNGLHFNGIYRILDDGKGSLWLSGTFGLQRIALQELQKAKESKTKNTQIIAQLFDTSDGMYNAETNGGIFPAGYKLQDGTLWFPTVEGVAIVDPASLKMQKEPVNTLVKAFRVGNKELDFLQGIVLPAGVNTIQIDYTSIQFNKPASVNFYYRLKELSDTWEFADKRRTAYFTSLEPGTYTFEVKAEMNGVWSKPAQLTFEIDPFFYQTNWFTALIVLTLFLAGFFVKKFLTKDQQEKALKQLVAERTKELNTSNARFKLVNKITFLVIWEYDLAQEELYWGESFESILGHRSADKKENMRIWYDNLHPEDATRVMSSFDKAIKSDTLTWQEEYRFRKGDGQYASIINKAYILRDDQGNATRMLGSIQDVTKAKEEEQRLKLLESVITNATDAVIITDAQVDAFGPKILYVNKAFTKMTGYPKEEAIGQSPRFLQGPNSDREELDRMKAALLLGEPCEIDVVNYRKNGEEFIVNMNVSPVTDQKGNLTHFISIERDFTERREYLKAIEDQNSKLREIAWIQSHVVRAPLARILGLIYLLEDGPHSKEDLQTIYGYIKSSGLELDTIIRDIVKRTEEVEKEVEVMF
ncbi:two-component regulator propeller domain-containing protein [Rufibacter tibetensis]|uniref:histidine kinase n=1 Tax=Rufibacter tibetensis TaxID=512763 RepID=A0A0P0CDN9_9BACT|nr:two-component regulator propeller domain-containing protein [Rufibacter tibetensis]ALI99911.1 hypothetical protein DC20_14195 [Rufibacter tibetensis]